jgi:signal transduction histidine kinase
MPTRYSAPSRIAAATLLLATGLVVVGWFDYRATRQDLLILMIDQAASLRQAVAAAARSAEAATAQVQATLSARLLDNARFLDQIDRRGGLTQTFLDSVARQHRLFRVTVFSATGARVLTAGLGGPPPWAGRGPGTGGPGSGAGTGGGSGAGFGNATAERLLSGPETETVSEVHGSRWGSGWRLSAGVRRSAGGAIVLNVDASDIAELQRQASLDHLLSDIAARAGEIAYVILVDASARSAHGRLADAVLARAESAEAESHRLPLASELAGLTAYELMIDGHPVLEFSGPVDATRQGSPFLRLGLSLDGLRAAERRSLTRLVLSLLAALGLGGLTIAFVGLRREHGVLREQHARAEAALRRRDRLAAMGELASTVAHEVRNPLNAIGMSVQRLRREFLDAPPGDAAGHRAEQRELLDVLSSETSRINRIVQQFLEFARPPQLAVRPVDLATLLAEVTASAAAMAGARDITLETTVDGAGEAVVDPDQLRQALDNLLRNAIDASPKGSVVALYASRAGHGHRITVEDHGPGIAADHLPRIFDLYFTTKADGTGVGLAVTHQIVEAHGGTLEVDTELGRGTRMIIDLPSTGEAQTHG